MKRPGRLTRLWCRLIGVREVERTADSFVLRLPWFVHGKDVKRLEARLRADARLAWRGDDLSIEYGDKLVRVTRVRRATVSDAGRGYDAGSDDPRDRSAHAASRLGGDAGDEAGREPRRESVRRVDRS